MYYISAEIKHFSNNRYINKTTSNAKPDRSNVDSIWQRLAKAKTPPVGLHGLAVLAPTYRM